MLLALELGTTLYLLSLALVSRERYRSEDAISVKELFTGRKAMGLASRYWTLIRLDAAGKYHARMMSIAQAFFEQQISGGNLQVNDRDVQFRLMSIAHHSHPTDESITKLAVLCLRCYVSHHIVFACVDLTHRFGDRYHFKLCDLLPFVLDDQGRDSSEFPRTLAHSILQTFQSEKSSLATWTVRLVKQHRELDKFLILQGLYRLSDWAILNDTTVSQLHKILTQVYELSTIEVQQSCMLLESYHAIYSSPSSRCFAPSIQQLHSIAQLMQIQQTELIVPNTVLIQLQCLAKRLRRYRIAVRGGTALMQSIHQFDCTLLSEKTAYDHSSEAAQIEFLRLHRRELIIGLDAALISAIQARLLTQRSGRSKGWQYQHCIEADRFLQMLYLLYVRNLTMREIANQVGLSAQYQVTRSLRLKQLRSEVHHSLFNHLTRSIVNYVVLKDHDDFSREQIEAALNEQIKRLLQDDVQHLQTAVKHRHMRSQLGLFAQRVGVLLNQPRFTRYVDQLKIERSA